jgi:hypothetical protein
MLPVTILGASFKLAGRIRTVFTLTGKVTTPDYVACLNYFTHFIEEIEVVFFDLYPTVCPMSKLPLTYLPLVA